MFFDDGYGLVRIMAVGPCAYIAIVLVLRASGKRTVSKVNALDFILTVAGTFRSRIKRSRITEPEVQGAIRESGNGAMDTVAAVVLETDGRFSVITAMPDRREVPPGVNPVPTSA